MAAARIAAAKRHKRIAAAKRHKRIAAAKRHKRHKAEKRNVISFCVICAFFWLDFLFASRALFFAAAKRHKRHKAEKRKVISLCVICAFFRLDLRFFCGRKKTQDSKKKSGSSRIPVGDFTSPKRILAFFSWVISTSHCPGNRF